MNYRFLAITVLGLAACSEQAPIGTVAASEPPKAIASTAAPVAQPVQPAANPDKDLGQRVARAIETAKLQGIDIAVADGVVTLWGAVPSERARALAAQVARKVEGVKALDNKLAVVAGS